MAATVSANSAAGWPPGPCDFAVKDAAERRLEPFVQIALELAPGRPEPGAAMQVGHPRRIPGRLRTGLIWLPGATGDHQRAFVHSRECSWLPLLEGDRAQVAVLAGFERCDTRRRPRRRPTPAVM